LSLIKAQVAYWPGWPEPGGREMRETLLLLCLLAGFVMTGCKDFPGADGRYADFDRGRSNFRAGLSDPPSALQM